jgi:hypothetical protein
MSTLNYQYITAHISAGYSSFLNKLVLKKRFNEKQLTREGKRIMVMCMIYKLEPVLLQVIKMG